VDGLGVQKDSVVDRENPAFAKQVINKFAKPGGKPHSLRSATRIEGMTFRKHWLCRGKPRRWRIS